LSRADTLLKVKQAEESAKKIVDEAGERSRAILASARKDAVKLIQDAEKQVRADFDSAITKEKVKIASQRDALLSEGREKAAKLETVAEERILKVKDYLKQEFERTIDVTAGADE